MFSQASVILFTGEWGVQGRGACMVGVYMVGGMCGRRCAWPDACMAVGGMHGRGACMVGVCMVGGMCGMRCAWLGTCMAVGGMHARGGMHGRGHAW